MASEAVEVSVAIEVAPEKPSIPMNSIKDLLVKSQKKKTPYKLQKYEFMTEKRRSVQL